MVVTLADMEGNETFDPECLGHAEIVREERVGDGEMLYVRGTSHGKAKPAARESLSCRKIQEKTG